METIRPKSNLANTTIVQSRQLPTASNIPKQLQWRLLTLAFIISDILTIAIAFRLAYFIRFEYPFGFFNSDPTPIFGFYQNLVLVLIPLWLITFALSGLYNRQKILGSTEEYALIFNATTVGMFIVIAAGFLEPRFVFARGWLISAWGFTILLTSLERFAIRRGVYLLRRRGFFLQNAVIIGANNEGISLAAQLVRWKSSGLRVVGFVDKKFPAGKQIIGDLQVLGNVDNLDELISGLDIEELILASSAFSSRDRMMEIFRKYGISGGVNVRMSSGLYEIFTTGLTVKEYAFVPLIGLNKVRLTGIDHFLKLLLDFSLTIPGFILLFPVLILIALAVKFDSKGSIIYRRRVMGMNGRQFDAYKFRTMYTNGYEILSDPPELKSERVNNQKLKEDPRVTRVGKFLRKSSLDELPQLFNVLRRDMSLVGPRIIIPEEMQKYSIWNRNLLTVRPGITGLWQVSGRSNVLYEERVRMDMYYIRNWRIWLDLEILFRTVLAVLKGRGAY